MVMPMRRANEQLRARALDWAKRLNVEPRIVSIRRMTRKWGSCSTLGTVTLASDLTRKSHVFQDFVIAHELLHLRVPNHGRLFKALLSAHVPDWRKHELDR
jgi:predicted metal-dependent hydrolase